MFYRSFSGETTANSKLLPPSLPSNFWDLVSMLGYLGNFRGKKFHRFKSGHQMSSRKNKTYCPGIISRGMPNELYASCMRCFTILLQLHIVLSILVRKNRSIFVEENFMSISKERSEFTVAVALSSSKKYGLHTPYAKMAYRTITLGL